jgi:hypothetical protein
VHVSASPEDGDAPHPAIVERRATTKEKRADRPATSKLDQVMGRIYDDIGRTQHDDRLCSAT